MSTEENDKLARAYADLRADIARSGPGLVKVFRDQLTLVLDAVAPLTHTVEEVKAPADARIREGDTVEILHRLNFFGEIIQSGTKGVVSLIDVRTNNFYPVAVKVIGSDIVCNFSRNELRKVA